MKKLLLLALLVVFSCEDNTQTNDDSDDMISLNWILLKQAVNTNFYVEDCNEYDEYTPIDHPSLGGHFEYNCICDVNLSGMPIEDECGNCHLNLPNFYLVDSCNGYEMCDDDNDTYYSDCCRESVGYDDSAFGNQYVEPPGGIVYKYYEPLFYEYLLYWDYDDLNVCSATYGCDLEDINDYDIVIPSYIPQNETNECDLTIPGVPSCENESYFHPNCDIGLDTTIVLNGKSITINKMAWLGRNDMYGFIHYYPLDRLIFTNDYSSSENLTAIDISDWKIVDYQLKD